MPAISPPTLFPDAPRSAIRGCHESARCPAPRPCRGGERLSRGCRLAGTVPEEGGGGSGGQPQGELRDFEKAGGDQHPFDTGGAVHRSDTQG
mmetsp:Transcript_10740/g.13108  ORF Transcript_10740/g.13108 Transcript_10740/m.13108 type:complete len:92 (-) Transcript_10740:235-510(-)